MSTQEQQEAGAPEPASGLVQPTANGAVQGSSPAPDIVIPEFLKNKKEQPPPAEADRDPWQHRSQNLRCETCMWFAMKLHPVGRCRRRSPALGGYPVVFVTDWCGDHKLDERAL
jgi:hypothetical protein